MSVKIGIVGLGIGATHAASLAKIPDAEIVVFADLDAERVQKFAAEHGARDYPDWKTMLENQDNLDAVILATPAKVRMEPIRAICERGLALFCEKPPAVNLEEALKMRDVIDASGILNTVGFMYRWSPLAFRMKELIAGRTKLFARGVVAWPVFSWVQGGQAPKSLYSKAACGGPLIEQAIHYQDVMRYITEDEPVSVHAIAELGNLIPQENRDCEETTAYLLRHESGMLSNHIHNWSHKGTVMQIQVVGDDYELTWNMAHDASKLFGIMGGEAIDEKSDSAEYFNEMVGFVEAVSQSDQCLIRSSYADACKSMAVCEAATNAINSGSVVPISR